MLAVLLGASVSVPMIVGGFVLRDEDGTFVESVGAFALPIIVPIGSLELVSGALGLIDGALVDRALVDGVLVNNDGSLGATSSLGRFVLFCVKGK